ncbi:DNA polymerase III subunit psi [Pasteurella skyensis]|uniref:DNA polymerase III subunit psi n=1 Tax=Phocoenobacter skyensis TaxID=97481 RepID=A0AAJ6NZP8_9PAST|nr:DNA polymerase III subunit psi [Pasteurella skyensis]MDP8161701.1 DNA polymerase III subunit psi [Pasteurella skyensis]MDP8171857.1 DNA polymerase III subunit psi [Pasteurella skyensis]MDP8176094.1 DNA polymerase III subunit psi [Pasteurella skyensis]MDP8178112.1 DNA polymerase III subunit psi [Pasteurella skyensis]MDP8182280.1 DNA polymerase III subunit psi [Pasteurella skyensis]
MNRRDLLLNEMNITQWVLTKPQVLKGDAQIRLSKEIKLIVVSDGDYQSTGLFQDILYSLQLSKQDYQWVSYEQSLRLSFDHQPILWIIQNEKQVVTLSEKFANLTIWKNNSWQDLATSAYKRQFWQQIEPLCQPKENV